MIPFPLHFHMIPVCLPTLTESRISRRGDPRCDWAEHTLIDAEEKLRPYFVSSLPRLLREPRIRYGAAGFLAISIFFLS